MDIDDKLDEIIIRYALDSGYPRYRKNIRAREIILGLTSAWSDGRKVICIATGQEDVLRFRMFVEKSDVQFVICNEKGVFGKEWRDIYDTNALDSVNLDEADECWIISFYGAGQVGLYLRRRGIKYTDLYDYLAFCGINFDAPWQDFVKDHTARWGSENSQPVDPKIFELYDQRQKYLAAPKSPLGMMHLKNAFFLALSARDFILAEKIAGDADDSKTGSAIKKAWHDTKKLLDDIKATLSKRHQRDILMFWLDALPYDDACRLPFIESVMRSGVCFDNMYTVTPYTHSTLKTLFCGKKAVDDASYRWDTIGRENSIVLNELERNGYIFRDMMGRWRQFTSETKTDKYHKFFSAASECLWETLRGLLLSDGNSIFGITHITAEAHAPSFFTGIDDADVLDPYKRRKGALEALDRQLCFYLGFMPRDTIKILMSDHGRSDFNTRFHVIFTIQSENIRSRRIGEICSYIDFHKILSQLLENGDVDEKNLIREYAEVQDLDYYNGAYIARLIRNKKPVSISLFGYHGIVTKENIYIRFNNGQEWLVPNDNTRLEPELLQQESDICDASLLPYFRRLVHADSMTVADPEKRKYSAYIYKIYENAAGYNRKKLCLINQFFESLPRRVAIRMGGNHTLQLCRILTAKNREKIVGIIDNNPKCISSRLGYPIVKIAEMDFSKTDAIVLSSYIFLDALRKEAACYPKKVIVADIYQYLSEHGMKFDGDFFKFIARENDYEVGFPFEEFGV